MSDGGNPGATHFYGDGCDEAHGSWSNMEQAIASAEALADDLARVLDTSPWNLTDSVQVALARWRETRGR